MIRFFSIALVLLTLGAGGHVAADTLMVEQLQARMSRSGPLPARGMSMDGVESRFGPPAQRRAAVGDPPITRWEYPGYVVFFEHRHVIHTVVKR